MVESSDTLLIQGDSLPLPRSSISYDETWPSLLRAATEYKVINRAQSEKTTADLASENENHHGRELEFYNPSVLVLQVGIVDCAPRYLSQTSKELVRALPSELLTTGCIYAARGFRRRSSRRAYVSEAAFRENLRAYFERARDAGVETVVSIKILSAGEKYRERNRVAAEPIQKYNAAMDDIADEFDCVTALHPLADTAKREEVIVDEFTVSDGYHLNADGHERLSERVLTVLDGDDPERRTTRTPLERSQGQSANRS